MRAFANEKKQEGDLPFSSDDIQGLSSLLERTTSKVLKTGAPIKEAMGIENQALEGMYAQAYHLYNTGKYAEAIHIFRLLIFLNAMEPKYVMGLAASLHMLKEYNNAIQTYTMCAVLDPSNPLPFYHSSDCFIQMKDTLSAIVCLEMAINQAGDRPEYAKLKERAVLSVENLKKQRASEQESVE